MKTAVALRHLAFEDLGLIEPWLKRRGWVVHYLDVGVDELWRLDLSQVDLLVVLGGPIGAEDDALYPYLADEVRLIVERLQSGRPLLGICLGAQLLARALGARSAPMGAKEIGFAPLTLAPQDRQTPLAQIGAQAVLHWHGDQFALPDGVESLAATPRCPHQAFMVGDHAMAWQFHLEVDAARIEQWLIGHAGELNSERVDVHALRREAARHRDGLATALDAVMEDWFTRLSLLA
ncbi:glutamine amidotransferase [Roseateles sp. DC23W]|uniref:Glutamine amidotransferase n=1 Tax=Pelomonas dachongensis TaxID=3299029 RepID=A0ABW7EU79_9BURK